MSSKRANTRSHRGLTLAVLLLAASLALLVASASASAAVSWRVTSVSKTAVSPHGEADVTTTSDGSAGSDEIQKVTVNAAAGTFTLTFEGETTADIPYNAYAFQVQGALEGLASVGSGNVAVSGGLSLFGLGTSPYIIQFKEALGKTDLPQLQAAEGSTPLAGAHTYYLTLANSGDTAANGEEEILTVHLPAAMTGSSFSDPTGTGINCPELAGKTTFTCSVNYPLSPGSGLKFNLNVAVDPSTPEGQTLLTTFDLEGGGAPSAGHTVDPTVVSSAPPTFGLDAFDQQLTSQGASYTQASGHPELQTTDFDVTTRHDPVAVVGDAWPVEDFRDVIASLPAGEVGNPAPFSQCTFAQLYAGEFQPHPDCPSESQIGTDFVRHSEGTLGPVPIYNMVPPPGVPARFAYNVNGSVIVLDSKVRTASDYGIDVVVAKVPQGLAINGNSATFWGVPADPSHKPERQCRNDSYPSGGGQTCDAVRQPTPFFRTPSACAAPGQVSTSIRLDSWQHPGDFVSASASPHAAPGYPFPPSQWGPQVGTTGCEQVPFEPTLGASLTTDRADSPTGLDVHIGLPSSCWDAKLTAVEAEEDICQSDIREAAVTLPEGLSINPSAAAGRAGCSPAQIGLTTSVGSSPIHFDESPAACPDACKVGTVSIATPLLGRHDANGEPVTDEAGHPLPEPLTGAVYLASQEQNPFGSLLSIYLVAEGSGVIVKQAGEIELAANGQVTTRFDQIPQQPVSAIDVSLFGGPRAPLRTPASCGTYTAHAELTPWSGNPAVEKESSFEITQGCGGGFDPKLQAGAQNPLAGATSPFNLRISRDDGSQELAGLKATLPPGLSGYLKGIPYCPDAALPTVSGALGTGAGQEASPSCPAASQVGTLTVGAGAGVTPFYTSSGRVYLAGPYKGAPLSLAVVAPAVAGPFDLGSVVVRNALRIDPETAQITVDSDPFPQVLHGIPLDLRDIRVAINREHFTLNPTNCEEMAVDATISSAQGQSANRQNHFQVAGCDRLGFKPKLSLKLKGGTKRGENPALSAILKARTGDANISRIQVALPHSEFLDQSHIRTICTRVQFAADNCPKGSIYGKATATSPILDYPLSGPVYLRSSSHNLPDLVIALHGPASQPIEVDAVGRIDSVKGGIRTTFATVPDAPLTKVVLRMQGGKKSLLQNSRNLCATTNRADVQMDGQNGKGASSAPMLKAAGCGGKAAPKHHRRAGR